MRLPPRNIITIAIAALAGQSQAQLVQSNTSFCSWADARVNTVRDIVYLDGGRLYEELGFDNGDTYVTTNRDEGSLYYMDLSSSLNTASYNLTSLFHRIPYDQATIPDTLMRSYDSGVMFANDDRLYLYGGFYPPTDSMDDAPANAALAYEPSQDWDPGSGEFTVTDPSNVTRYVTHGAGVSSPSENLGFYVSGLRAPDWGPIWEDGNATSLSENMIKIDMSTGQDSPVWSNLTLPPHVPPRAGAEAVWLPVSESGAIVLIGGVTVLESLYAGGLTEDDEARSKSESPGFMQTVSVYDVASDTWYTQNTTGKNPGQLTQFCSVYASAPDRSSHNIYVYGGYDGLGRINKPVDNVYVLSIPAFEWTLVYSGGGQLNGRREHTCIKPYPDQMLVLGGRALDKGPQSCVDMIRVFNLNTLTFQDTYDTETWSQYEVPSMISSIIGGNSSGGATRTSPESWTNTSLRDVFAAKYNKPIATWYPEKEDTTNDNNTTTDSTSSSFPPWGGGLIGGLLGLLAVVLAIGATFWLQRRRKSKGDTSLQDQKQREKQEQSELSGKGALPTPAEMGVPGSHSTAEAEGWPVYEMNGRPERPAELPTPHNDDSTAESRT